jgi:hypothetical protein
MRLFGVTGRLALLCLALTAPALAETDLENAQREMNQETMSREFLAEQPEKVDAYIKEAQQKNLKPPEYTGTHWRAGYTCHDLLRYSWYEYRDCRWYHRYYGHYYAYP